MNGDMHTWTAGGGCVEGEKKKDLACVAQIRPTPLFSTTFT